MKKPTTWVLVADEAIARILLWPAAGDELLPVEELTDPDAHAKGADLRNDAAGRRAAGTASAGSTTSAGEGAKHVTAEVFARRVAEHLLQARQQNRYEALRIVAAPRFLGLLRKALKPAVSEVVSHELDKDLVHLTAAEITDALGMATKRGAGVH